MSTIPKVSFRFITLGVVAVTTISACASSDGRDLPLPQDDQFESIITTTTSTLAPDRLGVVEPETLASTPIITTAPPTVASTVASTAPPTVASSTTLPTTAPTALSIKLPWRTDGLIPIRHTCAGTDEREIAPAVQWSGVPSEAVELAVILTDETASGFTHWIVVGLDRTSNGIPENLGLPDITMELNSAGSATYLGPCPTDTAPHTYTMELLALSQQYESTGGPASEVVTALRGLALSSVTQAGVFPGV